MRRALLALGLLAGGAVVALAACGDTGQVGGPDGGAGDNRSKAFRPDTSGVIREVDDVEVDFDLSRDRRSGVVIFPIRLHNLGDRDLRVLDPGGRVSTKERADDDPTAWTFTWLRGSIPDEDDEREYRPASHRSEALFPGDEIEMGSATARHVEDDARRLRVCVEVEDASGVLRADESGERERMREWQDNQDILIACSDYVDFHPDELPVYGDDR